MAEKIGVNAMTVGKWERGQGEPRSYHAWAIIHLARAARVGAQLSDFYPDPEAI